MDDVDAAPVPDTPPASSKRDLQRSSASSTPTSSIDAQLTPFSDPASPAMLEGRSPTNNGGSNSSSNSTTNLYGNNNGTPHKSRSILNLTSSTLLGIYSPTGYDSNELSTPWGTGAQTPARNASIDGNRPQIPSKADFEAATNAAKQSKQRRKSQAQHAQPGMTLRRRTGSLMLRVAALFAIGVAYGVLITHLHDSRNIAPIQVKGIKRGRGYLAFWGVLGVVLGTLLPWLDVLWEKKGQESVIDEQNGRDIKERDASPDFARNIRNSLGADWNPVVRSVGAFVGIAFAIRKLPWQSTLQVSLTLALVNPVIWYLIDRSKAGFLLSTAVGFTGAAVLFSVNPEVVPAPATPSPRESGQSLANGPLSSLGSVQDLMGGMISYESIGVATWISSVLFCSCVCFGNIGRRLAWKKGPGSWQA